MQNILGTLTVNPAGPWVTFKQGKTEIRKVLKETGTKGVKTFRPRSKNRQQFRIEVAGGIVTADRKPGASIVFTSNDGQITT